MYIRCILYEIIQKIEPKGTKSWNHYIYNGNQAQNSANLQKSVFFLKAQFLCDFYNIVQIQGRQGERGDPDVSEYVWHIGVGSYFPTDIGYQSWVT